MCLCYATAAAALLQSCSTRCDPIDGSPPGSAIPGIVQARMLEWVAISFSSAWKGKMKVKLLSRVRLFATPWTAAHQASLSMGFSRQEYWSGVPLPSPRRKLRWYIYPLWCHRLSEKTWWTCQAKQKGMFRQNYKVCKNISKNKSHLFKGWHFMEAQWN